MTHAPSHEGYEQTDARARPVLLSGLVLALIIGTSLAVCAWITRAMTEDERSGERPNPIEGLRQPPEGPELQALPSRQLEQLRAWEQGLLAETAWIDPLNGIVRIPIERAMELVLEEGFPVRAEGRK